MPCVRLVIEERGNEVFFLEEFELGPKNPKAPWKDFWQEIT